MAIFPQPIPFKEADAFLASRQDRPTALKARELAIAWDAQARQAAFFSARVIEAAVLSRLHAVVEQVTSGQLPQRQAVRLLREYLLGEGADALARMGFAPPRGAQGLAQLASIPRLSLIVYQNVKMAQERGHYAQWKQVAKDFPYGIWRCGHAENHRDEHLARDGRAYPFDHPIWTQSPPGGEYNCHCRREIATEQDLRERGISPEPPDSPFIPSSLGFDPSREPDTNSFPKTVRPEYEARARQKLEQDRRDVEEQRRAREQEQARLEMQEAARQDAERQAREENERLAAADPKTAVEKRLRQIPGVQDADFDGWKDADGIQAVADQLVRLSDEYNVPPPFTKFTVQEIISLKTGKVSDSIGGIALRGDNINGIDGQLSINIKVLEKIPRFRKELETDADDSYIGLAAFIRKGHEAECLATHEFGHRIISRFMETGDAQTVADYINLVYQRHKKGWYTSYGFVGIGQEVSPYASTNWEEFWAEAFSVYKCGDKERLPRDIRAMVGNVLACIRRENPVPVSQIAEVTKLFRKEYKTLDKIHATIDKFGEKHVIIDTKGNPIQHNDIPRIQGELPPYKRRKRGIHKIKHGDPSNDSETKKQDQRKKCIRDINALQPGLADEAQRVYDQMSAIEKDVIHAYTMRDFYDINKKILDAYLANENEPDQEHLIFKNKTDLYETEMRMRVLEKLPKFKGTLYRGMKFETKNQLNDFITNWNNGKSPLTGFISTTYNRESINPYLTNANFGVMIIIHDSSKGSYLGHLSSTPADEEVLFSCNQKFRLMTSEELGAEPIVIKNGITYINVKEA